MKSEVETYLKNTFKLARSMVIKSFDTATLINNDIIKKYGKLSVDLNDSTTWKYYVNLSGGYYSVVVNAVTIPIDIPMFVESLDTGTTISFDKNTLINHPTTVFSYKNNRSKITNMLLQYPEQESLIKSILYPVDSTKAIEAKDYEILTYDTNLIENNEYSIIQNLQKWIYSYAARWYNKSYTLIDSLFLATNLSILYLNLVPKLLNIRLSKCLTDEAHSFHVKAHLESHLGLDLNIESLDLDLKLWIYKNISYLERNIGKQETLETIIKRFFINRGLVTNKYKIVNNNSINLKETFNTPDFSFRKQLLIEVPNDLVSNNTDDLKTVLDNETRLITEGGLKGNLVKNKEFETITKDIALSRSSESDTKILETIDTNIGYTLPIKINRLIIDNWINIVINKGYNAGIEFVDPETSITYLINQREALLLFVSYISKFLKIKNPMVPKWIITMGYKYGLTLNDINILTNRTDTKNQTLLDLTSNIPDTNAINTVADFTLFLDNLIPSFKNLWITSFITNDYIDVGVYKNTIDTMFQRTEVDLGNTNNSIDTELKNLNVNVFEKQNHNYIASMKGLILACTGHEIDTFFLLDLFEDVPMQFFDELTSYSIQNLSAKSIKSKRAKQYLNNSMLRITKNPIKHIYKPRLTIDWVDDPTEYYTVINECDASLLGQGLCEVKNYVTPSPVDTPPGGLINLSPMLSAITVDTQGLYLLARTSEYETIIA